MTQDIGPEDEVAEAPDEPVDEQETTDRRSTIRAAIASAILILVLLLFLCQYLGGAGKRSDDDVTTTATEVSVPPLFSEPDSETASEVPDEPLLVPDVIGMTRFAAISAIEAAGFRASVTDVYGTTKPANTVFEQHPSGGSALEQGGTVGLLVQARSKSTVTVPNLHGLTQSEAESRIRALGLEVVLSYAPKTSTRRVGRTYSQWPLAGEQVEVDGEVQIQVTIKP